MDLFHTILSVFLYLSVSAFCIISYHSLPVVSPTTHFLACSLIISYHSLLVLPPTTYFLTHSVLFPTPHFLYYLLPLTSCIISYYSLPHPLSVLSHSFPVLSPTTHFLTCSVYYFLPLTSSLTLLSPTTHFLYHLLPLIPCIISHHSLPYLRCVLSPTSHFLYYLPPIHFLYYLLPLPFCIISYHTLSVLVHTFTSHYIPSTYIPSSFFSLTNQLTEFVHTTPTMYFLCSIFPAIQLTYIHIPCDLFSVHFSWHWTL